MKEMEVGLELETTDYAAIYSASVNNYLAVTKSGKVKRKGVFSEANLSKNPDLQIIYNAAAEYLSKGVAIEETITKTTDITKFVSVRRVQVYYTMPGNPCGQKGGDTYRRHKAHAHPCRERQDD